MIHDLRIGDRMKVEPDPVSVTVLSRTLSLSDALTALDPSLPDFQVLPAPGPAIRFFPKGTWVTEVTFDGKPLFDDDSRHGLEGSLYIVTRPGFGRFTHGDGWVEGPEVAVPCGKFGRAHHHEGWPCGNPAHGEGDGWL